MARVVALLTDFGWDSVYVGVMKGVILSIAPGAEVVDITHGVSKFDVNEGAFLLYASYRYFPPGTVFVGVVDPGVGSRRRAVAIRTRRYFFVGPDNGLLLPAAREDGIELVVELRNENFFLRPVSATFHGRDIFSPSAAWIVRGVPLELLGPRLDPSALVEPSLRIGYGRRGDAVELGVVYIDDFGNAVLGARFSDVAAALSASLGAQVSVDPGCSGSPKAVAVVAKRFSDVEPGRLILYEDSFGMAELAVNRGSAADLLGVSRGSTLCLRRLG